MKIQLVDDSLTHIYLNLAQAYEAEFSTITAKKPDANGLFTLDTPLDDSHNAFIAFEKEVPIGLANISVKNTGNYEVCEFYIIPVFRKQNLGTLFVHQIWHKYPGSWQIKQIDGAGYATQFWRKAISAYGQEFEQDKYLDPYWGPVTRQCFDTLAITTRPDTDEIC